jgi:hypothetical protein
LARRRWGPSRRKASRWPHRPVGISIVAVVVGLCLAPSALAQQDEAHGETTLSSLGGVRGGPFFGLGTPEDTGVPWGLSLGVVWAWAFNHENPSDGFFFSLDIGGYSPSAQAQDGVDVEVEGLAVLGGGGAGYARFFGRQAMLGAGLYYFLDKSTDDHALVIEGERVPVEFSYSSLGLGADFLWLSQPPGGAGLALSSQLVVLFNSDNAQTLLRLCLAYGKASR